MIKYIMEQGSDLWHDIRCGKITGTRFKVLMSGETTKGYQDLINTIVAEMVTGKAEETYTNDIMQRGIDLEPEAIAEYEHLMEVEVERIGFAIPDSDHEFFDWVGVSPDGLIESDLPLTKAIGLEIKCPLAKTHIGYIEANKLPADYRYQVQGQMFVTGLEQWDFMSYYPDMKPFIIRVDKDAELHERFAEKLRTFIKNVQGKLEKYNNYDYLI